jgi:hypothetical protein
MTSVHRRLSRGSIPSGAGTDQDPGDITIDPAARTSAVVAGRRAEETERLTMADKSTHKTNTKKQGRTLKEKRAAKKAKTTGKPGTMIPPTDR